MPTRQRKRRRPQTSCLGRTPACSPWIIPSNFRWRPRLSDPSTSELVVTGTVTPDVARNVPVVSLASGRVVAIHARLGDTVQKGQLLLTIRSDDVAGGFDTYRKAVADELLARKQLNRAMDLYAHGAIAEQDLEVAQDTEDDAKVTLETATEHLRLLGNDPDKPMGMVDIVAPTSGVITDQEVTNAALVQAYSSPSPFTISDVSSVWIVCDVYENDMPNVRLGDTAEITLNAYPDHPFKGKVSNIGAILDPSIRTAKVRIEVENPGIMRLGMFARATFRGQTTEMHTIVPASAVLHMHDRDFVFVPAPDNKFRRVEVRQWRRAHREHEFAGNQVRAETRPTGGHERPGFGPRARSITDGAAASGLASAVYDGHFIAAVRSG